MCQCVCVCFYVCMCFFIETVVVVVSGIVLWLTNTLRIEFIHIVNFSCFLYMINRTLWPSHSAVLAVGLRGSLWMCRLCVFLVCVCVVFFLHSFFRSSFVLHSLFIRSAISIIRNALYHTHTKKRIRVSTQQKRPRDGRACAPHAYVICCTRCYAALLQ